MGWFATREEPELTACLQYIGPTDEPINWALTRLAYRSVADLAITPLQDVLGLGTEARMNTPGRFGNNWSWRFKLEDVKASDRAKLREMALAYGRKAPEKKQERPKWM